MSLRSTKFYGNLSPGKLTLDQQALWKAWLEAVKEEQRVEVVIQPITADKTLQQLRYFFGVIVPHFRELTGYAKGEADGDVGW